MPATRRRRSRKSHSALEGLKHRLHKSGLLDRVEISGPSSKGPKISAVLLEFIEPYRHLADTTEAFKKLIALAVVAWNAATVPGAQGQEFIDSAVETIASRAGEEWRKDAQDILATLVKRKQMYFAEDKRLIADYYVTERKDRYHVAVAAFEPG